MTALREAAQQAIALICSARLCEVNSMSSRQQMLSLLIEATDLLRAGLKQEEEASAWLAERKEYWRKEKEKMCTFRAALEQQDERDWSLLEATQESLREHMAEIHRLRTALAQQAEPVEPVAWLVMDESGYVQHAASWRDAAHEHINDAINEHDLVCARTWRVVPVYTAPPQRKPLTEEEIEHIGMTHQSLRQVVRAVERAHGIKEKG